MRTYVLALLALMISVTADAAALEVVTQLHPGESLSAALGTLNRAGYRIAYSSTVVLPKMTLKSRPNASSIDSLLNEILSPWNLRATRGTNGGWLVSRTPNSAESSISAESTRVDDAAALEEVNVTASRYSIADHANSSSFLDQQDVARTPHLLDDSVRILKGFPGVTGGDVSARLNIRGGRSDEVELLVNGAEIHNGFHFNELGGILSVVDTHLTRSIDLTTGGMTVDRSDYMSGVVDIETLKPAVDDEYKYAAGISFIGAFARASSAFAGGDGTWLVSARRGYMDLLVDLATDKKNSFTPRFQDVFSAFTYKLGDCTSLSTYMLLGTNSLHVTDRDGQFVEDNSASNHFWVNLDHAWTDDLTTRTTVAVAKTTTRRAAHDLKKYDVDASVQEDNDFHYLSLRQDWSWIIDRNDLIKWGIKIARDRADYLYDRQSTLVNPFLTSEPIDTSYAAAAKAQGSKSGGFASYRRRFLGKLFVELGGRWDRVQYPDHHSYSYTSPRVNALFEIDDNRSLRAAWGVIYQPQGIDQLQIEDGVLIYHPPERVTHSILAFTQRFSHAWSLRVDAYNKEYAELYPYFDNLGNFIKAIPEAMVDRVQVNATRARSSGIELVLRHDASEHWSGWVSYAYARAREFVGNASYRRSWDQAHTMQANIDWIGQHWTLGMAAVFHSGAPITNIDIRQGSVGSSVTVGTRNGDTLGSFARIDMRISRSMKLRRSNFSYYFEVINLLNSKNECCEQVDITRDSSGIYRAEKVSDTGLPLLPSIGFQFEF